MKEKNFVSAVIYVHNCEDRIDDFIRMVYRQLKKKFVKFEIICVDDASDDKSKQIIRDAVHEFCDTTVTVLDMSYFHGCELAMNAGVELAIGDYVYEFDNTIADYEEDLIFDIYKKALEGYDIVCASSDRKEKFLSHMFYRVFNKFSSYEYQLRTESFRIMSRRAINRVYAMNAMILYRKAVYANCGLQNYCLKYHPVASRGKNNGRGERNFRRNLAVDSLILFTDAGYFFAVFMTIIMMMIAFFTGIYAVFVFCTGNPVEGWTTTILFLSFAFLGLFAILAIAIKYLSLLVNLIFKKQHYRFSEIEKITQ